MKEIIIYIVFAIASQIITYKIVRGIDKKERKFLKKWEKEYIETYKDLWKESYFEKLAEEKKIKEYEKQLAEEKKETKENLASITIDDKFKEIYDKNLKDAIEKLEKKEAEK